MSEYIFTEAQRVELNRAARLFVSYHAVLHGVAAAIFLCPAVDEKQLWFALEHEDKILVRPVVLA